MDKSKAPNPQYFEGMLQLRGNSDESILFIRHQALKHPTAYISKEKSLPEGVDFYFSDNKFLRALGKKLKESFTGEMKISATLHTKSRQSSKELYRVTVLFRQLHFKKGDTFLFQGEKVEVLRIANDVLVKNKKTGEKKHMSLQEAEKASMRNIL